MTAHRYTGTTKEKDMPSRNPLGTKPVSKQSQKEFEAYVKHDQRRQTIERGNTKGGR